VSRARSVHAFLVLSAALAWACEPVQPTPSQPGPAAETTGPSPTDGPTPPSTANPPSSQPSAAPFNGGAIVDDPSAVPEWLRDRYVVLNGVVGQLGSDFSLRLSDEENVLGFGAGVIATALADPETHELIWRDEGLHVTIRDLATLSDVGGFDTPVYITQSTVIRSSLVFIGLTGQPGPDVDPIDAGIWTFDLSNPNGEPRVLQERRNLADEFGQYASRGLPRPAQRDTAVTTVISSETRILTEVTDLESGETVPIDTGNEAALAVVDGRAILVVPHEFAGEFQRIRFVDYPSLEDRSKPFEVEMVQNSVVVGSQEVFLLVGVDGSERVLALRLEDGLLRDVRVFDPAAGESFFMDAYLSTEDVLALTPGAGPDVDDQGRYVTTVSLLDTREGNLTPAVFRIREP